ncbi:MAG: hypothetical protein IPM16_10215 [Chloroflexi bacterium]|nr:hypothetical protein [Chloroflexota bacterium]
MAYTGSAKPRGTLLSLLHHPAASGTLLFAVCAGILGTLIFASNGFNGVDGYYHARVADVIIVQRRLALDFPWLPLTILSPERFVDHHLLYHLYLAPFAHWGGVVGAKLGQLAIASGVFVALWAVLRACRVHMPALWTIALFCMSFHFLYRLLMIRTQGAALLLLLVACYVLIQQRRHLWMLPLSFAFVWLYNGFVLMPVFAGMYTVADWIVSRRLNPRPLVYSAAGLALGLVVNPYFPQNIGFIIDHLGAKVDIVGSVEVGNEWYPYKWDELLISVFGSLVALGAGLIGFVWRRDLRDRVSWLLLFAALLTLFMLLRSRRFVEYYPAFALLFAAVIWGRPSAFKLWRFRPRLAKIAGVLTLVAGAVMGAFVFTATYSTMADEPDVNALAGAADWLETNTPAGALIFQTDYDDFTRLFFHNTSNTYLNGLDTTYLLEADPDLWEAWTQIRLGEVANPSEAILTKFGTRFIVSGVEAQAFIAQADADPAMRVVYEDEYALVWEIAE